MSLTSTCSTWRVAVDWTTLSSLALATATGLWVIGCFPLGDCLAVAGSDAPLPNIVILYADDLGYGDVSCYNPSRGRVETPNIDRLASEGVLFTDAHSSSAVCSPSRYTLLTGRYHWRTRLQKGIVGLWGRPVIRHDRMTLGSLAQQRNYVTACIGKWHLGWDWSIPETSRNLFVTGGYGGRKDITATPAHRAAWAELFSKPIGGGPCDRGFDYYFGTDVPNWPPYCFIEKRSTVGIPTEFADAALFARNLASIQGPALKNWKLEPILPALAERATNFIEETVEAKKPFLLYVPLTSPHTPLAVNEAWKGRSGLGAYTDLVIETDHVIGQILDSLERVGANGNTLVIFTSDNGCAPYIGVEDLESQGHFPSGELRGYKSDAWEGGHRVPFIARWPSVAPPGVVSDSLIHQADLFATIADILNIEVPDSAGEDSFSLLPALRDPTMKTRNHSVSCSIRGIPSIRLDHWKLILGRGSGGWTKGDDGQNYQLYDLKSDVGEQKNHIVANPSKAAELRALLDSMIMRGRSTPGQHRENDVQVTRY